MHFFQAAVESILLYGCTTWTLAKRMEKRVDGNYTRILEGVLNKSWRQHLSKQQLYGHVPPITKTYHIRWTRHMGYSSGGKHELISDILQWTSSSWRAKAGRPDGIYLHQLWADIGCSLEDLLGGIDDRDGWQGRIIFWSTKVTPNTRKTTFVWLRQVFSYIYDYWGKLCIVKTNRYYLWNISTFS